MESEVMSRNAVWMRWLEKLNVIGIWDADELAGDCSIDVMGVHILARCDSCY